MGIQHNADRVGARLTAAGRAVRAVLVQRMPEIAQRAAVLMKHEAPKWRSTLTNSIYAKKEGPLVYLVHPTVAHARWVNDGRKPGKGLPKFGTPAATSAEMWLRDRMMDSVRAANPKARLPRAGSAKRAAFDDELRQRYMGWSRSVKLRGIQADPFVQRTAEQVRQTFPAEVQAAVAEALSGLGKGGAA